MDRHSRISSWTRFFLVGGSRVSGCWGGFVGVSVDKFDTDLFGEGELNLLAGGGTESSDALGNDNFGVDNSGDLDGTFLRDIGAGDNGKVDGFVDTGLLGGGVFDGDGDIDGGDNGDVVSGFLGNFLAVVVSVRVSITISLVSGLADGDHLDIGLLFEGDLNGFGGGVFGSLFIRVGADFLGDNVDGFGTDGTGDGVGVWDIFDNLDGEGDIFTGGLNGRGADLSDFSHIDDGAVVFGFLITVSVVDGGGVVSVVDGSGVVWGRLVVAAIRGGGVGGAGQGEGKES